MLLHIYYNMDILFLFYNYLGNFHDWYLSSYLGFVRDIGFSSIIPVGIIFLYFNYKRTRKDYEILLKQPQFDLSPDRLIRLESENGRDSISTTLDSLLFIEAQDNYVMIHHLVNDELKKQLIRSTMKEIEANLKELNVVRCHRSFIVNINKVIKVKGDTHQMKLFLPHVENYIPVSRSFIGSLTKLLDIRHK